MAEKFRILKGLSKGYLRSAFESVPKPLEFILEGKQRLVLSQVGLFPADPKRRDLWFICGWGLLRDQNGSTTGDIYIGEISTAWPAIAPGYLRVATLQEIGLLSCIFEGKLSASTLRDALYAAEIAEGIVMVNDKAAQEIAKQHLGILSPSRAGAAITSVKKYGCRSGRHYLTVRNPNSGFQVDLRGLVRYLEAGGGCGGIGKKSKVFLREWLNHIDNNTIQEER
jgi:hypothetical protein